MNTELIKSLAADPARTSTSRGERAPALHDAHTMPAAGALTPSDWRAISGFTVSGRDVAELLAATLRLLDRSGWVGDYATSPGPADRIREARSALELLKSVALWAVEEWGTRRRDLTLQDALYESGDADTRLVARKCLQAVLAATEGPGGVDAWAARPGRTFAEVRELLIATIEFAIHHGPEARALD